MNTVLPPKHPYWQMRSLVEYHSESIKNLHLSYYKYTPQSLLDTRQHLLLNTDDFLNVELIGNIIRAVPTGRELAFHSQIETKEEQILHIPMIDMSTGSLAHLEKLRPFLSDHLFQHITWYRSGRSFHGYASTLVSPKEWASLMGTLLLANQPGLPPTVDPRWIGHRLIAGYSALRWTKNTMHYIEPPRAID